MALAVRQLRFLKRARCLEVVQVIHRSEFKMIHHLQSMTKLGSIHCFNLIGMSH